MARSETIKTRRLLLEPFTGDFLTERYVGWLNDPEVVKYSDQRFRKHTLDSCREYVQRFESGPDYLWAIVSREVEIGHIGNINAHLEENHGTADIRIMIGETAAQGRGYATEAWMAVTEFLFSIPGVRKVTGGTLSVNMPMLKIMEKIGMQEDGVRKGHCIFEGEAVDIVYMAFFRDTWNIIE